jgi:GNAT superfamily N-acetyltransferase
VDEAELARRRSQFGRSCRSLLANSPRSLGAQGPGFWIALSGAPSPDLNMVLVDSPDAATLAHAMTTVQQAGLPTLFMLAGKCRDEDLGRSFTEAGEMPFMFSGLGEGQLRKDGRVRQARPDDRDAFAGLISESFEFDRSVADLMARTLELPDDVAQVFFFWEGDTPVSTVLTSIVDDAVCVWCMATPPRHARRGFARALLGDVLARARDDGARVGLLGATPAGKPLYDATGWITLETWRVTTNAVSAQFAG